MTVSLSLLASGAFADSWMLYGTRVSASPHGRYYIVVDGTAFGGGCGRRPSTIHLVERAADRESVEARTVHEQDLPAEGPIGLVEAGDRLIASVRLEQIPCSSEVFDDGQVVLIDSYASMGYGQLVIVLDPSGSVRHSLSPEQVFPGFDDRFSGSVSSKWWCDASWIEEQRNEVVLLATDHTVRVIDLASGTVTDRDRAEALLSPTGAESERDLQRVWELAFEERTPDAIDEARAVVADASKPLTVRIRAAASVGRVDGASVRELFNAAVCDPDENVSRWAWDHLGQIYGAEACPLYRKALEEVEVGIPASASHLYEGMARIGEAAVDPTVDMLLVPGAGVEGNWLATRVMSLLEQDYATSGQEVFRDYRPFGDDEKALRALRDDGDLSALDRLLTRKRYMESTSPERHCFLALPALVQLQRRPDARAAGALADYLALLHDHPHNVAKWDERLREATVGALQACTGSTLGDDPTAWRAAVGD